MNWTLLTTIILTLASPFNIGLTCCNNTGTTQADFKSVQTQEVEQLARVEGSLEPGATLIGPDGISLTAPDNHDGTYDGVIRDTVEFYLETIDDPTTEIPFSQTLSGGIEDLSIGDNFEVISPFYRVGTVGPNTGVVLQSNYFLVNFTLPEGLTKNDVAILTLGDAGLTATDHDIEGLVWSSWFGIHEGPSLNQIALAPSILLNNGDVYVLVKTNRVSN